MSVLVSIISAFIALMAACVSYTHANISAKYTKSNILSMHFLNVRELTERSNGTRGIQIIHDHLRSIEFLKLNLAKDLELIEFLNNLEKNISNTDAKLDLQQFEKLAKKHLNLEK